jgi:exopolysaccharide biosynthesis polyprenyl glycosylphosphotransferase
MREGRLRTQAALMAVGDALMVLLAMQIAWWLRFDVNNWLWETQLYRPYANHPMWGPFGDTGFTPYQPYLLAVFITLPLFWLILREMGLYSEPEDSSGEFFRLLAAVLVASVLLTAISFYVKQRHANEQFQYSRGYMLLFMPAAVMCLLVGRSLNRAVLRALSRRGIGTNRILFVGTGPLAEELARAFEARGTNVVVGTLRADSIVEKAETVTLDVNQLKQLSEARSQNRAPGSGLNSLVVLGNTEHLCDVASRHACDEVIVAVPDAPQEALKRLAEDCYRAHVRFRMVPDVYEMLLDHMDLTLVSDIPLLGMRGSRIEGINFLCKRLFDIVVSLALLVVLVPTVFLFTAIAIRITDSGPIFYFQERIGYRRRKFRFWKFRSMRVGADSGEHVAVHKDYLKKYIAGSASGAKDTNGRVIFKLTEDPRVTPFGRFIRKFSIDELPQLWNVLKGDMSLIGPRPPIAYEVETYRPIHLRRFEVLPGISGLWQVSGRNELTFEEMIKLDLYYIENWSLELDVRILFRTIQVVLFQRAH